jgi:hypothetical protein
VPFALVFLLRKERQQQAIKLLGLLEHQEMSGAQCAPLVNGTTDPDLLPETSSNLSRCLFADGTAFGRAKWPRRK